MQQSETGVSARRSYTALHGIWEDVSLGCWHAHYKRPRADNPSLLQVMRTEIVALEGATASSRHQHSIVSDRLRRREDDLVLILSRFEALQHEHAALQMSAVVSERCAAHTACRLGCDAGLKHGEPSPPGVSLPPSRDVEYVSRDSILTLPASALVVPPKLEVSP